VKTHAKNNISKILAGKKIFGSGGGGGLTHTLRHTLLPYFNSQKAVGGGTSAESGV